MPELKQIMVFAALYKMYKRSHWNEDIFKDRDSLFTVVSKNTSHCSSLGSDLVGNWTFSKKYGLLEWNKADQWKETQLVCRQRSCCQQCSPGWISASQLAADWPSVHLPSRAECRGRGDSWSESLHYMKNTPSDTAQKLQLIVFEKYCIIKGFNINRGILKSIFGLKIFVCGG